VIEVDYPALAYNNGGYDIFLVSPDSAGPGDCGTSAEERIDDPCETRSMARMRWDGDERGRGIASGEAFVGHLSELASVASDSGWVAEEPEAHLLPHLQAACDEAASAFHLDATRLEGEVFVVDLTPQGGDLSVGEIRRGAIALAATIAEESTHIRQRREGDVLEFDVSTGSTGNGRFAPHGHLVRLRVHAR
jgi:hypothetical protein